MHLLLFAERLGNETEDYNAIQLHSIASIQPKNATVSTFSARQSGNPDSERNHVSIKSLLFAHILKTWSKSSAVEASPRPDCQCD